MSAARGIPDSLRDLLKCNVCLEEVTNQKALPCQHTICPLCLKQLTISARNKIRCPVCKKDHVVPNGGVSNFSDSLITKQLADLLKEENHSPPTSSKPSPTRNTATCPDGRKVDKSLSARVKRQQLASARKALDAEIELTNTWMRETAAALKGYEEALEQIDNGVSVTKETIQQFLAAMNLRGQAKIKSLLEAQELHKKELEPLKHGATKSMQLIKSSLTEGKTLAGKLSKLKSGEVLGSDLKKADECMEELRQHRVIKYAILPDTIKSGDSVRIAPHAFAEDQGELMANRVPYTSVGVFQKVVEEMVNLPESPIPIPVKRCWAIFREEPRWLGNPDSLILSSADQSACACVRDRVRVKPTITKPSGQWNGVRPGKSKGVLKEIRYSGPAGDLEVMVDFPECRSWKGLYSEIEKIPGGGFTVGDLVRVNRTKEEPSMGWAGVNGSSIGKITSITKPAQGEGQEEQVMVEFEECKEWRGVVSDIEISRRPTKGDIVQVKLTVKLPQLGWGEIKHSDIGELMYTLQDGTLGEVARVKFLKLGDRLWDCILDELELCRYTKDSDLAEDFDADERPECPTM